MVQVIIGEKGSGKTKRLLDAVHIAEQDTNGNVVFINKGDRHRFDLTHRIRLVDTDEFGNFSSYDMFLGFLCGMISQNYDIRHIFVDSITKIVNADYDALAAFLGKAKALCEKYEIELLITISAPLDAVGDEVKKYQ